MGPVELADTLRHLQLAAIGGYLLGSVPFGLVLTRLAGTGDIRRIGSGNIGATNVLRTGSKPLAALTLILDGGKGAGAALLFTMAWGEPAGIHAAGAAVIGHIFPVWLKFRGGKGVATALGALIGVDWIVGLAACATWLAVASVCRISSLAALVALGTAPLYGWLAVGRAEVAVLALVVAAFGWGAHHANIRRLLNGTEPRIGRRKAEKTRAGRKPSP